MWSSIIKGTSFIKNSNIKYLCFIGIMSFFSMVLDKIGVWLFGVKFLDWSVIELFYSSVFVISIFRIITYFLPQYKRNKIFIIVLSMFIILCSLHLIFREFNYFIIHFIQFLRIFYKVILRLNRTHWEEAEKEKAQFRKIIMDFLKEGDNSFTAKEEYFQKKSDLNAKIEKRKNHLKEETEELLWYNFKKIFKFWK